MRSNKPLSLLVCLVGLALAGCSEDVPGADPGGQGAGRPEGSEEPAANILQQNDLPTREDSSRAGAGGMTGTLRDSLNDGEAIPSVPQPDRPAGN